MANEHLAYISSAAPTLTETDIQLILEQSRRNNKSQRITGHLQCRGGYFFQVLEGSKEASDELLEKLHGDPRHADLRVLYREPMTRRNFANWSMGFGPCMHGESDASAKQRLLALRESGPTNAHKALSLFFSFLDAPPRDGPHQ
jgi:Sensors of blue-light using FAD